MRTNDEWLHNLSATGEMQEAALRDLRELLLRAALYFFSRNLDDLTSMNREEILQCAEDCAQEALIAVMNQLSDFRGDSKFTTWVYRFAINKALMTARRQRWKGVSLDQVTASPDGARFEWLAHDTSSPAVPDRSAQQVEITEIIQQVIERDLSEKQRQVLMLMVFHEVPMDEVVQRLGTNRNAVYKLLHDARRKLKSELRARGFEVGEALAVFSEPR